MLGSHKRHAVETRDAAADIQLPGNDLIVVMPALLELACRTGSGAWRQPPANPPAPVATNRLATARQPAPGLPTGSLFQLTAFFTSAPTLASSAAVNCVRAKAVGHVPPSSRCALSLKPSVAYLVLNFCALW